MLPVAKPATLASYYHKIGVDNIGLTKWEDLKNHPMPQDFADMLGWKEMTEKTAKAYAALTEAEKKKTIIFADNYGEAGAVNFYGHQYNLPEVYSANASYLYWLPANFHIDNLILITDDRHEMQKPFLHDFQSVTLNDSITDPYAREYGSLIITLKGANEQFNQMMQKKLAAEWAKFSKR